MIVSTDLRLGDFAPAGTSSKDSQSVVKIPPTGIALEASGWGADPTGRPVDYADERFFAGREGSGEYVGVMPVPVTEALLRRGQQES